MDINTLIIILSVTGALLIGIGVLLIVYSHSKKRENVKKVEHAPIVIDNNSWLASLGGKANIKEVSLKGSRLIVRLENKQLLDKNALHDLGASSIIESEDKITIVLRSDGEKVLNLLQ